jgi:hypothetical protein
MTVHQRSGEETSSVSARKKRLVTFSDSCKETLLASADSSTWVKISEMFLGPAPASWTFVPKHKSNAYAGDGGTEAQG